MTDEQRKAEIQRKLDTPVEDAPLTFALIQKIANTDMVPAAYRGKPDAIVAAVLTGRELNLPPFEAMRSIDVIDGKPSLSAELTLRLIREKGHKVRIKEVGPERVTLIGIRAEDPDDQAEVSYTWEEAHRVVTRYKGKRQTNQNGRWYFVADLDEHGQKIPESRLTDKDNWQNYPTDMLYWRCLTRLARWHFPDAIAATRMVYTPEELDADLSDRPPPIPADEQPWTDDDPMIAEVKDSPAMHEAILEGRLADELPEDDDIEDAEVIEPEAEVAEVVEQGPADTETSDGWGDEVEAWSTVNTYLAMPEPTEGNMDAVRDRIRRFFAAMRTVGLWPDDPDGTTKYERAKAAAGVEHLSGLKRAELDDFARNLQAWGKDRYAAHIATEGDTSPFEKE